MNKIIVLLTFVLCFVAITFAPSTDSLRFDMVIKNARILDGTGNPWFKADVGIKNDLSR